MPKIRTQFPRPFKIPSLPNESSETLAVICKLFRPPGDKLSLGYLERLDLKRTRQSSSDVSPARTGTADAGGFTLALKRALVQAGACATLFPAIHLR